MTPFFLSGSAGKLFCIYHEPSADTDDRGDLVFLPPFAEELNQSRHTVARMARSLTQRGWGVLLLDLFGTGDSAGAFEDCQWQIWRQDVIAVADWFRDRGRVAVGLWGLRLGALLAADLAATHAARFPRLVLWQPVTSGRDYLRQFLRMSSVSTAVLESMTAVSVSELRRRVAAGESVRVAGYTLSSELAQDLDGLDMTAIVPDPATSVLWFEVVTAPAVALSPAGSRTVDTWRSRGLKPTAVSVVDVPFWSTQALEPLWADRLIEATAEAL